MSSVHKKADKLNLSLSLRIGMALTWLDGYSADLHVGV